MKKIKQTENEVKNVIKNYLSLMGYSVYRINNAGVFRGTGKDGKNKFSFAGDAGVADLYAVGGSGVALWIETKATGKKPTEEQSEFGRVVNNSLGTYWLWADSLDMFIEKTKGVV